MAEKQFLVGVADVRAYGKNNAGDDVELFRSNTMLNTSIETSTGSTEISGGKRNKLLAIYYHTARMNVTLEDTVWNMEWVKQNTGAYDTDWAIPYNEPNITLTVSGTSVSGAVTMYTPEKMNGMENAIGSITDSNGKSYTINFAEGLKTFTGIIDAGAFTNGEKVCVEYYVDNADLGASSIAIPASIIPKVVRIVMTCDIASNKAGDGIIGIAIIEIPACQLSGAQTINMTSDGYSTVPLNGMALAYETGSSNGACEAEPVYAVITTKPKTGAWYDDVVGIAIEGGDFTMSATQGTTKSLNVLAITNKGTTRPLKYGVDFASFTITTTPTASAVTGSADTGVLVLTTAASANVGDTGVLAISVSGRADLETNCTFSLT